MMDPEALRQCYLDACLDELKAFKPGNISVHSEGHDMTVEQFEISARLSSGPLCDPVLGVGERIFRAIKSTNDAVGCNTNLGIVLLAAPLMVAAQKHQSDRPFRETVASVLRETSQHDAEWVYQAIRIAKPAGLGKQGEQDVQSKPSVTLTQAMALAGERDRVAYQYQSDYGDIFADSLPLFDRLMQQWHGNRTWVIVAVYLDLLKKHQDSHIFRKFGEKQALEVMAEAELVCERLHQLTDPIQMTEEISRFDRMLKDARINPGTTADLTVTTLLLSGLRSILHI